MTLTGLEWNWMEASTGGSSNLLSGGGRESLRLRNLFSWASMDSVIEEMVASNEEIWSRMLR